MDPVRPTSGWPLLRRVLWEQRKGLIAGMVVGLLWSASKVAVPRLTREAVDRGVIGRESLWFWSGMIAAAAVIAGVFSGWRRWIAFRESRLTETRLREQLFAHIMKLHVAYHDNTQTGQLMSRASSDMQQIQGFVVMIPLTASNLAMVVAVVVVLITSQPLLALIALAPLPVVNVLAQRFSRTIHPAVLAVQAEQAQLATVVEETVSGIRVVKGFGAEAVQAAKLRVEADDIRRESLKSARVRSTFLPALDLLPNLGMIAVLGIGGHRVLNGDMTTGQMLEFFQYIVLLVAPLRSLGMTVAFGQRAAAALLRVNEVLNRRSLGRCPPSRPSAVCDSGTSRSATTRRRRCCAGSTSRSSRADRWPWWAPLGAARAPSRDCSPASTTCRTARCRSTGSTCATSASPTCATRSASCSRTRSCSTTRSSATSRSRSPTRRSRTCTGRRCSPGRTTS
jgi:ATP-binding cassette subfamily B protein